MRQVRTAALSRHRAPSFVLLSGLELMQLRKLPWLARCLFLELLAMADHSSGEISTTYAVLAALLDFDLSPGAHELDRATTKRLRTALEQLHGLQLVRLDRRRNERGAGLFLKVPSRVGISPADAMKGRGRGRVRTAANQATARPAASQAPQEGQGEGQGVQERDLSPTPSLSTGLVDVRSLVSETKARIAAHRKK